MTGVSAERRAQLRQEFDLVEKILADMPSVDKSFEISTAEYQARSQRVYAGLQERGLPVGFVFSDEHYDGDVPYLGGNTNVQIEQVAGVVGADGFHIAAGLEGGYIAEQLAPRAGAAVHKVEMLKLADEEYPINAKRMEEVVELVAGGKVERIGLLSPREVVPAAIVEYLEDFYGKDNVVDCQELYYQLKWIKSDDEMRLIEDANVIADAMVRAMLAVLKPGMLETQVAAWGYFVAKELGSEENGWDVMVGANTANRTLIGKALNREIERGDYVHVGVAPKRDGLNSCLRRSLIAVEEPSQVTQDQQYWFDFVEEAYAVGLAALKDVSAHGKPAYLQEQALVDFFKDHAKEVSELVGMPVQLELLKPYTGTHNAGYTECQEFYGAITLNSTEPLGEQIVIMLDVAVRGISDYWDDVVIPGMDFVVVENTCGKYGTDLRELNRMPHNVQHLVGNADSIV